MRLCSAYPTFYFKGGIIFSLLGVKLANYFINFDDIYLQQKSEAGKDADISRPVTAIICTGLGAYF